MGGDDTLRGGPGADRIYGMVGNDFIVAAMMMTSSMREPATTSPMVMLEMIHCKVDWVTMFSQAVVAPIRFKVMWVTIG